MPRYILDINGEADDVLDRLARKADSKADALRRALSVGIWIDDMRKAGNKIMVMDKDGKMREVTWPTF